MNIVGIQSEPFDLAELRSQYADNFSIGAEVFFVGRVREFSEHSGVTALTLEHYPGMTESVLETLADEACARWALEGVVIIHRVGYLQAGDDIVLVMAFSAHRAVAFEACQYLMDRLKTDVPLWKKEHFQHGERWVEERASDQLASAQWKEG